jgi:hypothetical protein
VPRHAGSCHCGELQIEFVTEHLLAPRACQCGFCRRQGARMVSDPEGKATLALGPDAQRYRFGTRTTDFLFCGRCGVYVGAVAMLDGRVFATLNLNAFDDPRLELAATPVSYDGEDEAAKAERRRRKWTPARLTMR